MASEQQIDANRRNARLSTGPSTPEGKARASLNALTHGFTSQDAVLDCENRQQFLDLLAALQAEHAPVGPVEDFFVHQMACAQWRLQRLIRIETGFLTDRIVFTREYQPPSEQVQDAPIPAPPPTPDERRRAEENLLLGKTFFHSCSGDAFTKLFRYEGLLRRSYYKALDNLHTAQARRLGLPPPKK